MFVTIPARMSIGRMNSILLSAKRSLSMFTTITDFAASDYRRKYVFSGCQTYKRGPGSLPALSLAVIPFSYFTTTLIVMVFPSTLAVSFALPAALAVIFPLSSTKTVCGLLLLKISA